MLIRSRLLDRVYWIWIVPIGWCPLDLYRPDWIVHIGAPRHPKHFSLGPTSIPIPTPASEKTDSEEHVNFLQNPSLAEK